MRDWIISVLGKFGYLGVFLLILIENIFPPIPSELILTFAGFSTIATSMQLWGVILFSTLGSVAGALVLYMLGRFLSVERLQKLFASKLGRLLRLKSTDVKKAEGWFVKRGGRAVFFCRFVPIVRSLISIPAGMAKMNILSFAGLTVAGTAIWNTVLVLLGYAAGNAWETISAYFDTYSTIALVIFLATAAVLAMVFIKKRFLSDKSQEVVSDQAETKPADDTPSNSSSDNQEDNK